MRLRKHFLFSVGLVLVLSGASVFAQCDFEGSRWDDRFGNKWSLNEEGDVSGAVIFSFPGLGAEWDVSGSSDGTNFMLIATNPTGCGVQQFEYEGVFSPGCTTALGTWRNSEGEQGAFSMRLVAKVTCPKADHPGCNGTCPANEDCMVGRSKCYCKGR